MKYVSLLIIYFLLLGCDSSVDQQRLSLQGRTMGTTYQVDIIHSDTKVVETVLAEGIRNILTSIEQRMSNWREDSEISQFNRFPVKNSFPLSPDTYEVIALAQSVSKSTDGAFDITIGPLIELWGFGVNSNGPIIPKEQAIIQTRKHTGYQHLSLISGKNRIKKNKPITLNLSAVAKGYAVDKVAEYLIEQNITRFIVEVGGEIRAHGLKLDNTPWKIAIEQPDYTNSIMNRKVRQVVSLTNKAIATSGDYRNYFTIDGERYSHIINPETGRPVKHHLASVSVIDQNTARADALATAFTVMGTKKSIAFCEQNKIAAYFITDKQGQLIQHITPEFKKYLTTITK